MQKAASSKSFGFLLAAAFLVLAALAYWTKGRGYILWTVLAVLFFCLSLTIPRVLAPLKHHWLKFGRFLRYGISPIVLVLVYAIAIVPVGLIMRLLGKDLLSQTLNPSAPTYWINRNPAGLRSESLKDQF